MGELARRKLLVPLAVFLILFMNEARCDDVDLCDGIANSSVVEYAIDGMVDCNCTSCIRKCCAYGFYFSYGSCWKYNETNPNSTFVVPIYRGTKLLYKLEDPGRFSVGVNGDCELEISIPDKEDDEVFYVQEDGQIYLAVDGRTLSNDFYCIEDTVKNGRVAFSCETSVRTWGQRIVNFGMLVSIPFLLATFIIYACIPKKTTHMKAVMCYVMTYATALSILMFDRLYRGNIPSNSCIVLGYITVSFLAASFYWMNIICVDMWLNFRSFQGLVKSNTRKNRFLHYCIYVVCITIVHVGIIALIGHLRDPSEWYHPRIGVSTCALRKGWARFLYLYCPLAVLIAINVVLFILTAIGIWKVKKDSRKFENSSSRKHSFQNQRTEFHLFVKLLLAMGINWSLEILSFLVDWKVERTPRYIWYVTDLVNSMYGLILFLIFVVKKSTWKSLKERYHSVKDMMNQNIAMKKATPTTSCSEIYIKKEAA